MISVMIPVYKEPNLNHTIESLFVAAEGEIEVIVILNAPQDVDNRARIITPDSNIGERKAMNMAAHIAKGEYLFRLDGHCEMSDDWDKKLIAACKPRGIAVAGIVAVNEKWEDYPGFYTCCKLLSNMEEKWWTRDVPGMVVETMAFTGCGWLIRKDYYLSFGGADETLPMMGAIGPEFALQVWLDGDGCVVVKDVECKHIFGTGGYDTGNLEIARAKLKEKWGEKYHLLVEKFPDAELGVEMKTVKRTKTTILKVDDEVERDKDGKIVSVTKIHYKPYIVSHDGTKSDDLITEENVDKITEVERREKVA